MWTVEGSRKARKQKGRRCVLSVLSTLTFHCVRDPSLLKWLTWLDIVEKTVKDILQTMVSEGIVQSDKIGTSNCKNSFTLQRGEGQTDFSTFCQSSGRSHLLAAPQSVDDLHDLSVNIELNGFLNPHT
jgi:hypothetical protein